VFEDGQLLTNPHISSGPVRGGAPSGWTGMSKAVNPMKVVHYNSHYSITNSVIYVSAPNFHGPERLAMRLRDEQGRNFSGKPESQRGVNGVYAFLIELPSDVFQATPELVLLPPVKTEFTVKTPGISGATGHAAAR